MADELEDIDSISILPPRSVKYLDGYEVPPIPFDEESVPIEERKWIPDYHDQLIPRRKSFVSDFIYHSRGIMTPTLACIWSSLLVLQAAIKREAWVKWFPKPLYPNQYVLIIGPAGIGKKTTAITDIGYPILEHFRDYIRNRDIYEMKELSIVKDKTTPESLLTALLPENKSQGTYYLHNADGSYIKDDNGQAIPYTRTSEGLIISSELSVMLTKRSYSESMIGLLLDLYDSRDTFEWRREGAGIKKLHKLCTSLIGGTTVDGFRESIPSAAKGDGLISRFIMVYVPASKREYPVPFLPKGAPDNREMCRRLAWVAEHTLGEYDLTPEAWEIHNRWYHAFIRHIKEEPVLAGAMSRMDVNVLKTALLIRAARYEATEPFIDATDIVDAIRLVETTYRALPYLLGQLDDDIILSYTAKAEVYLSRRKRTSRKMFLTALHIRSDIATTVVHELIARGEVEVEYNGTRSLIVAGHAEEVYVWTSMEELGADAVEGTWADESYQDSWELRIDPEMRPSTKSVPHSHKSFSSGKRRGRPKTSRKARDKSSSTSLGSPCKVASESSGPETSPGDPADNGNDGVLSGSGNDLPLSKTPESEDSAQEDS